MSKKPSKTLNKSTKKQMVVIKVSCVKFTKLRLKFPYVSKTSSEIIHSTEKSSFIPDAIDKNVFFVIERHRLI